MATNLMRAQGQISEILRALNVGHIVWIDDQFAVTAASMALVVETLFGMGLGAACAAQLGLNGNADADDCKKSLFEIWPAFDAERRRAEFNKLLAMMPLKDQRMVAKQLFPDSISKLCHRVRVTKRPPSEWKEAMGDIRNRLKDVPDGTVMCLVDQSLVDDDKAPVSDGMHLLQEAFAEFQADRNRLLFGLLSQTFGIDDELTQGKKLAEEHAVPLSRFLPLSKWRLDDPLKFADGIRLTSLMSACAHLAQTVGEATQTAAAEAVGLIDGMSVYDFYQAVLTGSEEEGVWEVETLMRLFNIYHFDALRNVIHGRRSQLNQWTTHVRKFVRADGAEGKPPHVGNTWRFSKADYYEVDRVLNQLHLPLELGDVFEHQGKWYIAMGQPCDLFMRPNGRRSASYVTLAEILFEEPDDDRQRNTTAFPMKFFGQSGETAWVYFKRSQIVSLDVLDVAVFTDDGSCQFSIDETCPPELHGPWQKRFNRLLDSYNNKAAELDAVRRELDSLHTETIKNRLLTALVLDITQRGFLGCCRYGDGVFDFAARRIARYRQPRVTTLLQQWAAYTARPALDRDFSPEIEGRAPSNVAASEAAVAKQR